MGLHGATGALQAGIQVAVMHSVHARTVDPVPGKLRPGSSPTACSSGDPTRRPWEAVVGAGTVGREVAAARPRGPEGERGLEQAGPGNLQRPL